MKFTEKELFIKGFWTGFYGESMISSMGEKYCEGYMIGAMMCGLVTEEEVLTINL